MPPEKIMNVSFLHSKNAIDSKLEVNISTYAFLTDVQTTFDTGPSLCASSLAIRAKSTTKPYISSNYNFLLTMWIINANRLISST